MRLHMRLLRESGNAAQYRGFLLDVPFLCDLGIEDVMDAPLDDWSACEEVIDEAGGVELPLGFGRD